MKNIIYVVLIGLFITSCTSAVDKKHSENLELVKNYIHAVETLDYDGMNSFLDDNYLGLGPSYGDSIGKTEAIENWEWAVTNLYEKIQYNRLQLASVTINDGDGKGDWVASWAELNIVYKDGVGDVTIWANSNYLIENGKIVRSLTFYNEADALRQLGYSFAIPDIIE